MKKCLALSFALVTACSSAHDSQSSSTSSLATVPFQENIEFVNDARYVDGVLLSLQLIKTEDGSYKLIRSITSPGFGAPVETTVEELASGLDCRMAIASIPALSICSVDRRFVDGNLTEVIFSGDWDDLYTASLKVTSSGFSANPGNVVETELGTDLVKKVL